MGYKEMDAVIRHITLEAMRRQKGEKFPVPELAPLDRLVWIMLANHRNEETKECFPSYERLMLVTGMSRSALASCIRHLKKRVQVDRSGRSSRYSWELPDTEEIARQEPVECRENALIVRKDQYASNTTEAPDDNFRSTQDVNQKASGSTSEVCKTASNLVNNQGNYTEEETTNTYTYGCSSQTRDTLQKHGEDPVPPQSEIVAGFVALWKSIQRSPYSR